MPSSGGKITACTSPSPSSQPPSPGSDEPQRALGPFLSTAPRGRSAGRAPALSFACTAARSPVHGRKRSSITAFCLGVCARRRRISSAFSCAGLSTSAPASRTETAGMVASTDKSIARGSQREGGILGIFLLCEYNLNA
eukprot:scaffold133101_cov37-Tisochrysis_lutea.AAC.1